MSKNALWIAATGLAYILGAATAVLVMRERLDRKYKKIADEEIESVKEAFRRKEEAWKAELEWNAVMNNEDRKKLDAVYSDLIANKPKLPENDNTENVVYISPDEFGDDEAYDVVTITYYEGNCVFTDYLDEPIPDAEWEAMLGSNVAKQFGDYEQDRVCVRNDKRRTYYEILREEGEFLE